MPFTPFHFGPGILIGLIALRYLDFPTFVAANVVVDWRAALYFLGLWPFGGNLHSWPSTYPGAVVSACFLALAMFYLRPYLQTFLQDLEIEQAFSRRKILISAILGVLLHVTIDAFHHPNIQPFMITGFRPFFGILSTSGVRTLCLTALISCFPVYLGHLSGMVDLKER